MPPLHTSPAPLSRTRTSVLAVLVGVLLVLLSPPAAGHDYLVESDPAADTSVDSTPSQVTLRFSDDVLEVSPAILVRDGEGTTVAEGTPDVDGPDVTLPLPEGLGAGAYEVSWRVVSSDGHPIEGEYSFEVTGTEPEVSELEEPPAAADGAGQADQEGATVGPAEGEVVDEPTGTLAGLPVWVRTVIGVAAAGAVLALVALVVRRMHDD